MDFRMHGAAIKITPVDVYNSFMTNIHVIIILYKEQSRSNDINRT
jgi:hypothetical protein